MLLVLLVVRVRVPAYMAAPLLSHSRSCMHTSTTGCVAVQCGVQGSAVMAARLVRQLELGTFSGAASYRPLGHVARPCCAVRRGRPAVGQVAWRGVVGRVVCAEPMSVESFAAECTRDDTPNHITSEPNCALHTTPLSEHVPPSQETTSRCCSFPTCSH